MALPDARDQFQVTQAQLGSEWTVVNTYQQDNIAYCQVPGLRFMPWEFMPRTEGAAVCFAGGGDRSTRHAEAILFLHGVWHHIRKEERI